MEVPKTIDISSLFYFSGASREGGKGVVAIGNNSSNQQQEQQDQLEEKKEAGDEDDQEKLEQMKTRVGRGGPLNNQKNISQIRCPANSNRAAVQNPQVIKARHVKLAVGGRSGSEEEEQRSRH